MADTIKLTFQVGEHIATAECKKVDLAALESFLSGAIRLLPQFSGRMVAVALIEIEKENT